MTGLPNPAGGNCGSEQVVGDVGLEAEFVAGVAAAGAAIAADDAVEDRIGAARHRRFRIGMVGWKGRVIMTDDLMGGGIEIFDGFAADEAMCFGEPIRRYSGHIGDVCIK